MRYLSFCTLQILSLLVCLIISACNDDTINEPIKETGSVTDIDGNTYLTVRIGTQWWMAENLRVTTFQSGEKIEEIGTSDEWSNTGLPAFTNYNSSSSGLLYNFYVISGGKEIAPEGWRVPSDEDWKILEEYVGMPIDQLDHTNWRGSVEGDKLKEETTITGGWIQYDGVWGTNETGFSAAGGGCRVFNGERGIPGFRHTGFWWSSTEKNGHGWYRYLDYKKSGIFRYTAHPNYGFSIRCVKN